MSQEEPGQASFGIFSTPRDNKGSSEQSKSEKPPTLEYWLPQNHQSPAWDHFRLYGVRNDKENSKQVCQICSRSFAHHSGTGNMIKHLEKFHRIFIKSLPATRNPVPAAPVDTPCPALKMLRENEQKRMNKELITDAEIDRAIAIHIAVDKRPFLEVSKPGFQNMLKLLKPDYNPPSPSTMKNICQQLYGEVKENHIKKGLASIRNIHITTDEWKSPTGSDYLGVTAHGLDDSWEVKKFVLALLPMEEASTADYLSERLEQVFQEYGIQNPVITTDQGPNMKKAIKNLGAINIPCCAHRMNLVVQQGLDTKPLAPLLAKVKVLVQMFRRRANLKRTLRDQCAQLSGKTEKDTSGKIKKDTIGDKRGLLTTTQNRWNSTYLCLQRLWDIREAVVMVASRPSNKDISSNMPSEEEWGIIEEVCKILKPFHGLTESLSASNSVTSTSAEVVMRSGVWERLVSKKNDHASVAAMKKAMREKLEDSDKNISDDASTVLRLCTFLNPDVKQMFQGQEGKRKGKGSFGPGYFQTEDLPQLLVKIGEKMGLFDRQDPDKETAEPPSKRRKANEDAYDERVQLFGSLYLESSPLQEFSKEKLAEREVALYLHFSQDLELQPAAWWAKHAPHFPILQKLANCLLGVPATSVPSEQLFSQVNLIITDKRHSLNHDTAQVLAVLQSSSEYLIPGLNSPQLVNCGAKVDLKSTSNSPSAEMQVLSSESEDEKEI